MAIMGMYVGRLKAVDLERFYADSRLAEYRDFVMDRKSVLEGGALSPVEEISLLYDDRGFVHIYYFEGKNILLGLEAVEKAVRSLNSEYSGLKAGGSG